MLIKIDLSHLKVSFRESLNSSMTKYEADMNYMIFMTVILWCGSVDLYKKKFVLKLGCLFSSMNCFTFVISWSIIAD